MQQYSSFKELCALLTAILLPKGFFMFKQLKRSLLLFVMILFFSPMAHADLFSIYVRPKIDYIGGTGDVFKKFSPAPSTGLEAGVELLGLTLFADGYWMGQDQFLYSGNVGFDFSFGDTLILKLGIYGNATLFKFPQEESKGISFSAQESMSLQAYGVDISSLQTEFNKANDQEAQISNLAMGVGGKGRASLSYKILPLVDIGVQGSIGYHYLLSGEEVAGEAKSRALDVIAKKQNLPSEAVTFLKAKLNAKNIDTQNLNGTNYSMGVFVNIGF
jgi:hypothetical protein